MSGVTQILDRVQQGDPRAADELLPLVYDELRRLAAVKMASQPAGQTLQATALVHEAWLKLTAGEQTTWQDRQHFFRTAAEAMRQILIDRARKRLSLKRGGNLPRVNVDDLELAVPPKEEVLLQLNEALEELKTLSPERAEIVKLRFFGGFNESEIADLLQLSERTVQRQWRYARAWLFERIAAEPG